MFFRFFWICLASFFLIHFNELLTALPIVLRQSWEISKNNNFCLSDLCWSLQLGVGVYCDCLLSESIIMRHSFHPPKIRGFLVFKIWTIRGVIQYCSEIGVSWIRGVSKLFYQFSFRKACFHYIPLECFFFFLFLSNKYSHLL